MSFNKRIITKEQTIKYLNEKSVSKLFGSADALFFNDEFTLKVYESYIMGLTDVELFNIFKQDIKYKFL